MMKQSYSHIFGADFGRKFLGLLVISLILNITNWSVWYSYGDHTLVPASSLWIATGLLILNLTLSIWALPRERFASFLLVGATIVVELLTIVFLYII